MVQIGSALIPENILEMVGAKGPTILPLRVTEAIPFANGNPTIAADRLSRASVRLFERRDHQRCSPAPKLAVRRIVVRKRDEELPERNATAM